MMIFFQAEDGIRDIGVTGVQTCALPIYRAVLHAWSETLGMSLEERNVTVLHMEGGDYAEGKARVRSEILEGIRSEERRAGKVCRSRWPPYHYKKSIVRTSQRSLSYSYFS